MVRVSRRVLKVPKAIASLIGVSRGLSKNTAANSRKRTESALGPIAITIHILATGRTRTKSRPPAISKPSSELFGNPVSVNIGKSELTGYTRDRRTAPNGSRRPTRGEVHASEAGDEPKGTANANVAVSTVSKSQQQARMNLPIRPFGFLRFTPERFHVLLNSLFKVLFNFPSRYLFAIGLVVVFSLRWSLPPT